jgi:mycothiol synthase
MAVETVRWRALTADDVPALTRLYAAVEAVDRTGDNYSEQDVRDELQDGATLAAFGSDGEILAFARVDGSHIDGAVLPVARGQGLGRRLLGWAEERAASLHSAAVRIDVHENNPTKAALVRAAGYEEVRWEFRMARPIDGTLPEVPPTPSGLVLTRYTRDRDEAVRHAHGEAFADHWGAIAPDRQRWQHAYTGRRAFRPHLSWLVLDGEEVAGYLLTYFWEADAAATGVREAFVGQLGVRRPWRRRGVGGLLLATALRSYRADGCERAVLTVDTANPTGALGLYERAGFVVTGKAASWTKPLT